MVRSWFWTLDSVSGRQLDVESFLPTPDIVFGRDFGVEWCFWT